MPYVLNTLNGTLGNEGLEYGYGGSKLITIVKNMIIR